MQKLIFLTCFVLEITRGGGDFFCSDIANKYGIKVGGVKKLIPNLGDKIKYVVHYRNFHYYLLL